MKKILEDRSKILFAVAIINTIIFFVFIPELLEYSRFISNVSCLNPVFDRVIPTMIIYVIGGHNFVQFNFIIIILMMLAALTNIIGFIYKRQEFNFFSIALYLIISCMSLYVFYPFGILFLSLLFILSVIGYVDQYAIDLISDSKKALKPTKKENK